MTKKVLEYWVFLVRAQLELLVSLSTLFIFMLPLQNQVIIFGWKFLLLVLSWGDLTHFLTLTHNCADAFTLELFPYITDPFFNNPFTLAAVCVRDPAGVHFRIFCTLYFCEAILTSHLIKSVKVQLTTFQSVKMSHSHTQKCSLSILKLFYFYGINFF